MALSAGPRACGTNDAIAGPLVGVAWPAALLGLVALVIPLLIHLLARGEFQRVAIATTRFVRDRPKLRWRRLQISHPLLLALRMTLVALCVFLIAEPFRYLPDNDTHDGAWTFVSAQLDTTQAQALLEDSDVVPRWLAPGFPSLEQPRPKRQPGELWSLLDAADKLAPSGIPFDIIVPTSISPPGARRPAFDRVLRWIDAGSVTAPEAAATILTIDVVYDPGQEDEADAIATAVAAWQDAGLSAAVRMLPVATASLQSPFVMWLSTKAIPQDENSSDVVVAQRPLLDSETVTTNFAMNGAVATRKQYASGMDVHILENMFASDGTPSTRLARDLLAAFLGPKLYSPPTDYPVAINQLNTPTGSFAQEDMAIRGSLTPVLMWLIALFATLERVGSALVMRASHDP